MTAQSTTAHSSTVHRSTDKTQKTSGCEHCPVPGAISPSQIKLFSGACKRKWAFKHILKLPEPQRSFQALGQEVHKHLEHYTTLGTLPPVDTKAGQIATVGLDHLPKPSPKHIVEKHLRLECGHDLFLHGYPDLIPADEYAVYDYKTTSNLSYAITPAALQTDPQALVYGMWLQRHRQSADPMQFVWLYYRTRPPYKLHVVRTTLPAGLLKHNFNEHVLNPAREMLLLRRHASATTYDPNELPGNAHACDAYGGCPYRDRCSLHTDERPITLGSIFKKRVKEAVEKEAPVDAKQIYEDATKVVELKKRVGEIIAEGVVPPDAPEPVLTLDEGTADATQEPPKKKRGRKPKGDAPAADSMTVDSKSISKLDLSPSYTLCINTVPMGDDFTLLYHVLAPLIEKLSQSLGVPYFRLAKEAEYGRADALLITAWREDPLPLSGRVYVNKRDPDEAALIGVLSAGAAEVYQGGY